MLELPRIVHAFPVCLCFCIEDCPKGFLVEAWDKLDRDTVTHV